MAKMKNDKTNPSFSATLRKTAFPRSNRRLDAFADPFALPSSPLPYAFGAVFLSHSRLSLAARFGNGQSFCAFCESSRLRSAERRGTMFMVQTEYDNEFFTFPWHD